MEKIKDSEGKIFRILKMIKRLEQKEILNGKNEVFIQIGDCFDNGDKNSNCGFRIVRTI